MLKQTVTKLRQLKLSSMANVLLSQAEQPNSYQGWPLKNSYNYWPIANINTEKTENNNAFESSQAN